MISYINWSMPRFKWVVRIDICNIKKTPLLGAFLKRLRIYFLFDRKHLAKLSICAWNVIKRYLQYSVADNDVVPGDSIAVQTYGDFLNFNTHLHAIVSDGCFSLERMVYIPAQNSDDGISKVVYTSKDRKSRKVFNALDWLPGW